MLKHACYIDTRAAMFAAPDVVTPGDYAAWLKARYDSSRHIEGGRPLLFGVAQRIRAAVESGLAGHEVFVFGPHAGPVAALLEESSGGEVIAQVLTTVRAW